MDDNYDVVVAGAGLAGLSAAATASRAGRRVLVIDGRPPGGRARTDERSGFLFNQGAHALYLGGHATEVLAQVGLGVPPGAKPSKDQWGVTGERVSRLPFTPSGAARSRLLGLTGKAQLGRFLLRLRATETSRLVELSASRWLEELDLDSEVTEILRTLCHVASYADDLDAVSADAVAAQLQAAVIHGVRYVHGGWRVLIERLWAAAEAAGAELRTGTPVVGIDGPASGAVVSRLADGTELRSAGVVLAVGGPAAVASLLRGAAPWDGLGPPATAACLDLGLRRPPPKRVLFGVGEPLYLSTHAPAADLAPPGASVVHVMRYGARDAPADRAQLWAHAHTAGIREDDVVEQRFLARMTVTHAVPVPGWGLRGRPDVDAPSIEGVYMAGDWVGPHGLLADCALASGQAAGFRAASHSLHACSGTERS